MYSTLHTIFVETFYNFFLLIGTAFGHPSIATSLGSKKPQRRVVENNQRIVVNLRQLVVCSDGTTLRNIVGFRGIFIFI
jgi:hypothetical protein